MTAKLQNLADLFIADLWEDFDALPLPLQALEVQYMKEKYEQYSKRYQRNCGALSVDPENIWTDESITHVLNEVEKIKSSNDFLQRQGRKGTDFQAYVIYTENLFKMLAKDNIYVEKNWKTLGNNGQKKIINAYAKAYKQAVYRYNKKKK